MNERARFRLLLSIGVVTVLGTAAFLTATLLPREEAPIAAPDPRVSRLLDGILVDPGKEALLLVAVVTDGMVEGRPTVGLAAAPFVWEAPVEGGITRFLAVYPADALPDTVGPVRSLRPYFLDFAGEVSALLAHVGGSPEALRRAVTSSVPRLNQFYDHVYFWRSTDRTPPHNVFTSRYLIERARGDRGLPDASQISPWRFARGEGRAFEGEGVAIDFSTPPYVVEWRWDASSQVYARFFGGILHTDADGTRIAAKNVIVQKMHVAILDAIGRRRITTDGEGEAIVLTGGARTDALWRRTAGERSRFYAKATGEEIAFAPGTTWVEVVPTNSNVEILTP